MSYESMPPQPGYGIPVAIPVEPRHSVLGIASFILSLLVGFLILAMIVIATVIELTTPGGMDEESPAAIMTGCGLICFMGLDVVALLLGIIGLFQKNRKKIFAILGITLSGLALLGTIALMIIGILVG